LLGEAQHGDGVDQGFCAGHALSKLEVPDPYVTPVAKQIQISSDQAMTSLTGQVGPGEARREAVQGAACEQSLVGADRC
jgi:hypothetical protein